MQQSHDQHWPPDYTIRISRRAKHLSLNISHDHGLEVVLPRADDEVRIIPFLEQNRKWVEKHLAKASYNPRQECADSLPHSVPLRAIEETWAVEYINYQQRAKIVVHPHEELVIFADLSDPLACRQLLIRWIRARAKQYLGDYLSQLSADINLDYCSFRLRGQRSRWGSCSSNKDIILNYKLIFLPAEIVRYVLIHELCHTVYLDHSFKFWQLVEKFVPNHKILRKQLHQQQHLPPSWLIN